MDGGHSKSMNILVAWPHFVPRDHAGAVRGAAFADAVVSLGWKTLVVTPEDGCTDERASPPESVQTLRLYDSYAKRYPPPFPALLLPLTVARLSLVASRQRSDAIISSSPGLFLALEALLVSKLVRVAFFLDIRDAWKLEERTHAGYLRNRFKRRVEGFLCRHAARVWAVTDSLARMLVDDHHLPPGKVSVVPNGADLSRFRPRSGAKTFDLIFLGVPSVYRDLPRLFGALWCLARRRPSVRIVWVGWRPPDLTRMDQSVLEALVSRGVLELLPPVAHQGVPGLLNQARAGVVSLSHEDVFRAAVGAKTYEYLACGLPLFCLGPRGQSELRRLVESENVGFFSSDPDDFSLQVNHVLSDGTLMDALSRNCLRVAAQYDRLEIAKRALLDPAFSPRNRPNRR